jgi:copper chaperone CopZ
LSGLRAVQSLQRDTGEVPPILGFPRPCRAIRPAIRSHFPVKSVRASHTRKTAEVLSEQPLDEQQVRAVIDATGYRFSGMTSEEAERQKGLFFRR